MPSWLRRRREFWNELNQIQQDEEERHAAIGLPEEPPPPRKYLPFDRYALFGHRVLFWLAPSWLFIDARERNRPTGPPGAEGRYKVAAREEWETAVYATVWLCVLAALCLLPFDDDTAARVVGFVALFRLLEIGVTVLGFVLGQRDPKIARSLLTIAALALQVAFIFAILDHSFAPDGFVKPEALPMGQTQMHVAETPFEYLYLSWTYMTTLGNDYVAESTGANILQLAAATSGIFLLGIVVARAIGVVDDTNEKVSGLEERIAALEEEKAARAGQTGSQPG